MFKDTFLTDDELHHTVARLVTLHVGDRHVDIMMGIMEVGYLCNQPTVLQVKGSYNEIDVSIARMTVARVGSGFHQLLYIDGKLHCYLPSTVDADDAVWKIT